MIIFIKKSSHFILLLMKLDEIRVLKKICLLLWELSNLNTKIYSLDFHKKKIKKKI